VCLNTCGETAASSISSSEAERQPRGRISSASDRYEGGGAMAVAGLEFEAGPAPPPFPCPFPLLLKSRGPIHWMKSEPEPRT